MINDKEVKLIKELVCSKGYIYTLCMIVAETFYIDIENIQNENQKNKLSVKEVALLFGFLIQDEIDFSYPKNPVDLIKLKDKTYILMNDLHNSFMRSFVKKSEKEFENKNDIKDFSKAQKDFFASAELMQEPIFYSGTGVYDFQYLDFLERKYKYDKDWLIDNKNFDFQEIKNIANEIKNILQKKIQKININNFRENKSQILKDMSKQYPNDDIENTINEMLPMLDLFQYKELFYSGFEQTNNPLNANIKNIQKSFYEGLLELFVIKEADFKNSPNIMYFLENFSLSPQKNLNFAFKNIGEFNLFNSKPIIQIDKERYFIPINFLLNEAIYENPFYWMSEDGSYKNQLSVNRGKTGEEISYEFLLQVFGKNRVFKSVKITTQKGKTSTDIDVLCILGNKALCVQVKSKKLTNLARTGNGKQLKKDFKGAVQDAYKQGLVSRNCILNNNTEFFNESGKEIYLSNNINEVYIMGITTENYPSLTHQVSFMLDKKKEEPFPIFLTIFDLELVVHYLKDPYDFLYYVRQRISLMDYLKADEEIVFLSNHLQNKPWRNPQFGMEVLDYSLAQNIDRDYFSFRSGLNVSDNGNTIKNRWINKDFEKLCNELKETNDDYIVDVIFSLLDFSSDARHNLIENIIKTKNKTSIDRQNHDFSLVPDNNLEIRIGVSYISLNCNNMDKLNERLLVLSQVRKYKSKGDIWIGIGGLKKVIK
jgi:hypothetical protein